MDGGGGGGSGVPDRRLESEAACEAARPAHVVLRPSALPGAAQTALARQASEPQRQRVKALSCELKGSRDSGYCADSPSGVAGARQPAVFFMDDHTPTTHPPSGSESEDAFRGADGSRNRRATADYERGGHSGGDDDVEDDDDETFYDAGNVTPARGLASRTPPVLIPAGRQPASDGSQGASAGQQDQPSFRSGSSGFGASAAAFSPPPTGSSVLLLYQPHMPRSCPAVAARTPVAAHSPEVGVAALAVGSASSESATGSPAVHRHASTQTPSPSGQALLLGRPRGGSAEDRHSRVQSSSFQAADRSSGRREAGEDAGEDERRREQRLLGRLNQLPDLLQNSVASAATAGPSLLQRRQRAFSESSAGQVAISEVGLELRRISDAFEEEHRRRRAARAAEVDVAAGAAAANYAEARLGAEGEQRPQEGAHAGGDAQPEAGSSHGASRPHRGLLSGFRYLFGRGDGRPSSSWPSS